MLIIFFSIALYNHVNRDSQVIFLAFIYISYFGPIQPDKKVLFIIEILKNTKICQLGHLLNRNTFISPVP